MEKTLYLLRLLPILLLIGANNAYAWYCHYTPSPEGWVTNLNCVGISNEEALAIAWCPYYPQDPICGVPEPVCQPLVENQSLACPVHYSGAINQMRSNSCPDETMGPWVTTSDNCSPDPPTCQVSTQENQVACQDGYTGAITLQQSSTCPDPYGVPIFGPWVETLNSCKQELTNVQNVTSPVSPTSVIEMPMSAPVMQQESVTAPTESVQMQTEMTNIPSHPLSPTDTKVETKAEAKAESSASTSEEKETKSEGGGKIEVPKGRDLVPGFGLVMSLDILNAPAMMQEQSLAIALDYTQELESGTRSQQGFIHGLLMEGISDNFYNLVNGRWDALRSSIEVQPNF